MLNIAIYENLYIPGKFIFRRTTFRIHASIKKCSRALCVKRVRLNNVAKQDVSKLSFLVFHLYVTSFYIIS